MILRRSKGVYSSEHEKFYREIMRNEKINIHKINKATIDEIDKYLKSIHKSSIDILKESVGMRINDLELDLGSFIGNVLSLVSVELAVIPTLMKYLPNNTFIKSSINLLEVLIAFAIAVMCISINKFFFKRKSELLFNKFLLNRIEKMDRKNA